MKKLLSVLTLSSTALLSLPTLADTIDPTAYAASLGIGESVTIRKTVTIEETISTGIIDVVFLIDTSGSMGSAITAAKAAAADILTGLSGFGNLATGAGYYSEPGSDGLYRPLTTSTSTGLANINAINLGLGGGGGDIPEEGINAVRQAAEGTAWRSGSNRFVIALGDATFKESDGATVANTLAALNSADATFIGIDFSDMTNMAYGGIDPTVFADATGGSIVNSGISSSSILDAILDSVGASFATYSSVGVGDLGAGLPGVGVAVNCVSAATGTCSGSTATGSFDRSVARTFEFDVTFTGLAGGTHDFLTHALVDGSIVASEADRISVGGSTAVPEPGALSLIAAGLVGMGLMRRRTA